MRALRRILKHLRYWYRGGNARFTVACDLSPFSRFGDNTRETLLRVRGLRSACRAARHHVSAHPCGQARVLRGWHFWEDERQPTKP